MFLKSIYECYFFTEETITLEAGPLEQFSHAIEPQLRQLGMFPTLFSSLKHGFSVRIQEKALVNFIYLHISEFCFLI